MMIAYKKLEKKDIAALTPIMKAAFDEDTRLHTDLLEDGPKGYDTGELLEKILEMDQTESKIILCDGVIVGEYTIIKNKDIFTLDLLFIDPAYHGKGLGYMVWKDIEKTYSEVKTWIVETPSYSTRNHKFYNKCGFKVIKKLIYNDDASSLLFIKHMKKYPIHIREYCEEKDYEHILASCKQEKWLSFYDTKKDLYKQALASSFTFVAYENEQYCGYIRCLSDGAFTVFCCEIIVDDAYKRKGIGKLLIEEVTKRFPTCSIDVISDADNFYKANQFMLVGNGFRKISG